MKRQPGRPVSLADTRLCRQLVLAACGARVGAATRAAGSNVA